MSGKIKICGLYREEDIEYINRARPDYAGFVFYPPSHRNVTESQMGEFRRMLDERISAVGVFVDEEIGRIARLLEEGFIDIVQLHGKENEEYIAELRRSFPGTEIWKAICVRSEQDLVKAEQSSADKILLDNGYGTGTCFDWGLLGGVSRPFILAGGLRPDNIVEALERFHPEILDVSSGVETDKKKDEEKIKRVIENVRNATREAQQRGQ